MSRAIIVPQADETDIKTVLPPRANLSARGTSRQTSPARRRISRNSDRNPGVEGGSVVMGGRESGTGPMGPIGLIGPMRLICVAAAVLAQAGAKIFGPGGVPLFTVQRRAHQFLQVGRLRVQK